MWLEQLDAIPALSGETITIPCHINYPSEKRNSLSQVTWKMGSSDLCSENDGLFTWRSWNEHDQPERFSLVNFPDDVSLIIKDVRSTDQGQYCCEVSARSTILRSTHGTELAVGDFNPHQLYKVLQPQESFVKLGDSGIINCSFSSSVERLSRTGIYWTVGSPAGKYSYHPSQRMIHSRYRDRTSLIGQADLHIKDIQSTDSGTYYCIVILRFCTGTNKVKSIVIYGAGTRLNVTGKHMPEAKGLLTKMAANTLNALTPAHPQLTNRVDVFLHRFNSICAQFWEKLYTHTATTLPVGLNTQNQAASPWPTLRATPAVRWKNRRPKLTAPHENITSQPCRHASARQFYERQFVWECSPIPESVSPEQLAARCKKKWSLRD
ncbi:sialic acid-binding Ig-like lectin 14 [Pelobates cultripes]|uniref:Sialic acid-binding Ig-like lectin 14 n=1 Tax=Pelobates cultripes TaxID=61616 RepID=A0AAD1RJR5_PELCU|nr:sialic acid-binding Ig-like lectin 14 [Pelobates cultripes]